MKAGRLDRQIEILAERMPKTQLPSGEEVETWEPIATVWAEVTWPKGQEQFQEQQRIATELPTFRVRYLNGITPKNRIRYAERQHDILRVAEIGRREGLTIDTRVRAE